MNLMIQPNQICLIVKLYNNRPKLLPDSNELIFIILAEKSTLENLHFIQPAAYLIGLPKNGTKSLDAFCNSLLFCDLIVKINCSYR